MKPLRFGVMGCSSFAQRAMIPAILASKGSVLAAVASRQSEKAVEFAQRFGCDAVTGYEELLKREDIAAIYMPLPTGLHQEWVSKTLQAGKHLLVEKSFATDLASAKSMVDLARSNDLIVLENFLFPHHSQHAWICEQLSSGVLGELKLFRTTFGFPPMQPQNFRYQKELGGGALLDAGAYVLKSSQVFLGDTLRVCGASLRYDTSFDVDTYGDVMLESAEGVVVQASFGFNYFYQCNYEFLGTRGKLTVDRAYTPPPGFRPTVHLECQDKTQMITLPADNHYTNMVDYFVSLVAKEEDPSPHLDAILRQATYLEEVRNCALSQTNL
jgi:NDP-hexose-3-ketoreductase